MFTKAKLEIYNIDVEDIITTSNGKELEDTNAEGDMGLGDFQP